MGVDGMAPAGKLSALQVARIKEPGYYGDGGGLWLQVTVGSDGKPRKSWIYRFKKINGKHTREMGLGPLSLFGLQEARTKAVAAARLRYEGIDPIEARRAASAHAKVAAAKEITFRECAESFISSHQARWHNAKHAAQWGSTLETYAYSVFGPLPIGAIDTALVSRVIEPLWSTKPETASRLRGRIEAILDWAKMRGYRDGENPARWRGRLDKLLPPRSEVRRVKHHAALPYAEMPAFMQQLLGQSGGAARALEFTILTAARTGETIGARWSEINLLEKLWIVPGARMKAAKEHRVPLCARAVEIIEEMAELKVNNYVFPGQRANKALSNMAMLAVLKRMKRTDLTTHGFRSSFRDWAAEQTEFPAEVAELSLAHGVGNKVEAAYRRGDLFEKRRQLIDDWAEFCVSASMQPIAVPSLV
jgi:integrase